jgi:hypothetical protein
MGWLEVGTVWRLGRNEWDDWEEDQTDGNGWGWILYVVPVQAYGMYLFQNIFVSPHEVSSLYTKSTGRNNDVM